MITTSERVAVLGRVRRKRHLLIHRKPYARIAIQDTAVIIDALEMLVTLNFSQQGASDAEKKQSQG